MEKATIATPLYISVAWTLMITYQFFTQTAVETATSLVAAIWPSMGTWLLSRMDMVVFIHAFAWVFLLSSAIPSIILGKGRGVLIQFSVCLTLTLLAFVVQDILIAHGSTHVHGLARLFLNPFLAIVYLSLPYLLMLGFDIYSRRRHKTAERLDEVTEIYLEDTEEAEEASQEQW